MTEKIDNQAGGNNHARQMQLEAFRSHIGDARRSLMLAAKCGQLAGQWPSVYVLLGRFDDLIATIDRYYTTSADDVAESVSVENCIACNAIRVNSDTVLLCTNHKRVD